MDEYVCLIVPAIDAGTGVIQADFIRCERVTRCRDCAHAITSYHDGLPRCAGRLTTEAVLVSPDGFCAWARPREGE